ncbi:MAG: T9SS type A sorting domain-containing protein, partial [Gemmatimonadetes bacterium]|nr:T9SS type A sorting domain-containing protein [Gemmatimonadota bacterium]
MRAATFGNGVWEIDLPAAATGVELAGLPESGLGLAAPRPNPSRGDASLAFVLPAAGPVRLAVYDAAGRRVATLIDGPRAAGRGEATWDGRDENGSAVAAGVYFARLETPSGVRSAKISRIR